MRQRGGIHAFALVFNPFFNENLNGYISIHKCKNSKGGGVAILIKKTIEFYQLNDLDFFNNEILTIKVPVTIDSSKKDLHIINIYQPPPLR